MTEPVILSRLQNVRRSGVGWTARCPAHADRTNSLSIGIGRDQRTLLHCFAGCETPVIVAATNLAMRDLFAAGSGRRRSYGRR